jgi:uncharacterized protein (DUF1697 family)
MASAQIAFLRGINVGSHRRVSMPDLRKLLSDAGYENVQTLLQSGNIVLSSSLDPAALADELHERILSGLEVDTEVVVRTRDELADAIERNPLPEAVAKPKFFQVTFLSGAPDPAVLEELLAADYAPEKLAATERELYAWHPDGMHKSKLARLLSNKKLGVTATARNWNTVTKLLEMADAAGG